MAFYDDMQDVATDLLTEFGKSITFTRITKTFNKITLPNSSSVTMRTVLSSDSLDALANSSRSAEKLMAHFAQCAPSS